jgi:hypothetical protein
MNLDTEPGRKLITPCQKGHMRHAAELLTYGCGCESCAMGRHTEPTSNGRFRQILRLDAAREPEERRAAGL